MAVLEEQLRQEQATVDQQQASYELALFDKEAYTRLAKTGAVSERQGRQAAEAQVRSGERTMAAARAERLPSLSLNGDYGVIGTNPSQSHGTFSVTGTLRFSIWEGGRIEGNIEQARAALTQR